MKITPVSMLNTEQLNVKNKENNDKSFDYYYKNAMGLVSNTNDLQLKAEEESANFILGKSDNIHSVMIAQEKANVALQFTVQLTSKALEAYREIIKLPV